MRGTAEVPTENEQDCKRAKCNGRQTWVGIKRVQISSPRRVQKYNVQGIESRESVTAGHSHEKTPKIAGIGMYTGTIHHTQATAAAVTNDRNSSALLPLQTNRMRTNAKPLVCESESERSNEERIS